MMKIGKYQVHVIETGRFALDGGAMFGVVPKVLWEKSNPPDERNRITLAARALLLVGDGKKILIDVGNGGKFNDKLKDIYRVDNTQSDLLSSLKTHGCLPADITHVLLTHLHFDHAGGSTLIENGEAVPSVPRARYLVQKEHWRAANSPTEKDRASFMKEDFVPLQYHSVLDYTDGEDELFPGIRVVLANGHTTALQLPLISDGTTTLFYCADLVPTAAHVALPWIMAYDLRPLVTLEEKRALLNRAVDESWILFFEHDPRLQAARLMRTDKGIVIDSELTIG